MPTNKERIGDELGQNAEGWVNTADNSGKVLALSGLIKSQLNQATGRSIRHEDKPHLPVQWRFPS